MGNRKWDKQTIIESIHQWVNEYGSPPSATDWNPAQARRLGHEDRVLRFQGGDWPYLSTVRKYFGTWNAALTEAGYPTVTRGGYARRAGYKKGETRL